MNELQHGTALSISAAKSGMSENTARKYAESGLPPSEVKASHEWRTRHDPFDSVSDVIHRFLTVSPGLLATTLLGYLQQEYPDQFHDGHLRSLQRRIKTWKATEGSSKEVFFDQVHHPGDLGASDFCHMTRLAVTVAGQVFVHLLYHFVLTYSNWEFGRVCFGETFESLSEGLQDALFVLGGVPARHRTDSLTAAVNHLGNREEFTDRYQALLRHYGVKGEHTQPSHPNENGDAEQSHNRIIIRVDQALLLRGSREFASREEYGRFLKRLFQEANKGRAVRFAEDRSFLKALPTRRLDSHKDLDVRVTPGSLIRVMGNVYSVPSRLIGELVRVRVGCDVIEVTFAQRVVQRMARLRGKGGSDIDYRHVIEWLVRKPGAFEGYIHFAALFPSSQFRIAYDSLTASRPAEGKKEYLQILLLAANQSEPLVEEALRSLLLLQAPVTLGAVKERITTAQALPVANNVRITPVNLQDYDSLLSVSAVASMASVATSPLIGVS